MPVSACWSPVVRCNLACPHCLDDTTVTEGTADEMLDTAEILAASELLAVDISGGEPLVLACLEDLADRLIAPGRMVVSVTTNGWFLARRAQDLAGRVDAIRVSLDAADRQTHDAIRGPGSHKRALDGIRAAVGAGMAVQVQTVVMARNLGSLQPVVDLAADLGAVGVSFLQLLPIGTGNTLGHAEAVSDDHAERTVSGLDVPDAMTVRVRTREAAGGFTVIRADRRVYHNTVNAATIATTTALESPSDLRLAGRDGSS